MNLKFVEGQKIKFYVVLPQSKICDGSNISSTDQVSRAHSASESMYGHLIDATVGRVKMQLLVATFLTLFFSSFFRNFVKCFKDREFMIDQKLAKISH